MASLLGLAGAWSALTCLVAGLALSWFALAHVRRNDRPSARDLFLASLVYLPVVLGAMAIDRGPMTGPSAARGGRVAIEDRPSP